MKRNLSFCHFSKVVMMVKLTKLYPSMTSWKCMKFPWCLTLFNNSAFIYNYIQHFCINVFNVCCRYVVCRLWYLNPFPHTAILQQTTLNVFCQKMENLYNWMDNLRQLHVLCNFFFCHYVFKKPSAAEASESVYMRERVNKYQSMSPRDS